MVARCRKLALYSIAVTLLLAGRHVRGFIAARSSVEARILASKQTRTVLIQSTKTKQRAVPSSPLFSKGEDSDEFKVDSDMPVIIRGSEEDEISDEVWENVETGQPPQWVIMKELLGINIFTYVLAGAIVVFLSLNFVLGPGWLGQALGMKGTGTFTDVSPSLPATVDLNDPDFLL